MMQLLTEKDFCTSTWSGGRTKTLFLYPPQASYTQRNFQFRISVAHTAAPQSTFTDLPGIQRQIMLLEGSMQLTHDGGAPCTLRAYQTHSFDGGAHTLCKGRAADMNLMLRACQGTLTCLQQALVQVDAPQLFLLSLVESWRLTWRGQTVLVPQGALVYWQGESGTIYTKAVQTNKIIKVAVTDALSSKPRTPGQHAAGAGPVRE